MPQFPPGQTSHASTIAIILNGINKDPRQQSDLCLPDTPVFERSVEQYSNYGHSALLLTFKSYNVFYATATNVQVQTKEHLHNHTITFLQERLPSLAARRVRLRHLHGLDKIREDCATAALGRIRTTRSGLVSGRYIEAQFTLVQTHTSTPQATSTFRDRPSDLPFELEHSTNFKCSVLKAPLREPTMSTVSPRTTLKALQNICASRPISQLRPKTEATGRACQISASGMQ